MKFSQFSLAITSAHLLKIAKDKGHHFLTPSPGSAHPDPPSNIRTSAVFGSKMPSTSRHLFDATAKFPRGIVSGNVYNMGDFDECLAVAGPMGIRGQYCLARVDLEEFGSLKEERQSVHGTVNPFTLHYSPMTSAWEKIEHKGDRSKHRRDQIFWAICSPSSCSTEDVRAALGAVVGPLANATGATARITVDEKMCEGPQLPQGLREWTAGDYVFM
ncbi:nose resistant to fluoxetine protein 6-like [Hetaerina americana]|uniref:nose resistant to fluoxetine protein 6-like n=1 Tax=Hetaerina americana TaxID=62018 RepID=UPI003A7F57BC